MKIVGLITEYNPFHNGHKYHLDMSKKISGCDYSVCIMSGNFVQRGEPAIVDKFHRAKMAVINGIDLVIELPVVYALRSAEAFAYGGIALLNSMNIIDSISFGSECGDIEILRQLSEILYDEPVYYKKLLKDNLNKGLSFPKARSIALSDYIKKYTDDFNCDDISSVLSSSNNILGLEYLKALQKLDSNITAHTYKRVGSSYNSENLSSSFSSATSIRKSMKDNFNKKLCKHISTNTYKVLNDFYNKYGFFNCLENYNDILLYLLRTNRALYANALDIEKGLDDRIYQASIKNNHISDIIESIKTKRYTYTRIKRILMHLLLNIDSNLLSSSKLDNVQYFRVLAMNENGMKILKQLKKHSDIPIITKFSNYKQLSNDSAICSKLLSIEKRATDIYFLPSKKDVILTNLDYSTSPYIHKV
ncbi:nucleotidyltransferase [Clostridiaceae bacterium M8S5]|nr:nucleotidyltransferase [Clostridiaceae bacterium M8S5]